MIMVLPLFLRSCFVLLISVKFMSSILCKIYILEKLRTLTFRLLEEFILTGSLHNFNINIFYLRM